MKSCFQAFVAVLLALVLAGTGAAIAYASGQMAAGQQIVICTGHGVTTIRLKEEGAASTQTCPDCVIGALSLAAEAAPALWRASEWPFEPPVRLWPVAGRTIPWKRARGPPVLV